MPNCYALYHKTTSLPLSHLPPPSPTLLPSRHRGAPTQVGCQGVDMSQPFHNGPCLAFSAGTGSKLTVPRVQEAWVGEAWHPWTRGRGRVTLSKPPSPCHQETHSCPLGCSSQLSGKWYLVESGARMADVVLWSRPRPLLPEGLQTPWKNSQEATELRINSLYFTQRGCGQGIRGRPPLWTTAMGPL